MRGKSWAKIADEQFKSMPQDFQADWEDLRARTMRR